MSLKRGSMVVLAIVFVAGLMGGWVLEVLSQPEPAVEAADPPTSRPPGQNGMLEVDRDRFYRLSEGGELYPIDWLLALEVESPVAGGGVETRRFVDTLDQYGLLPDPPSASNPDGLPVGLTVAPSKINGIDMMGLNCAACHVGQIHYDGRAYRIDGLGNMSLINGFVDALATTTEATLRSPDRLARFWRRVHDVRAQRRARGDGSSAATAPDETLVRRVLRLLTRNRGLLEAQVESLRNTAILKRAIAQGTPFGWGRLDALGVGRVELFDSIPGNDTPPTGPVSIPHIWGLEYTGWLQWGANLNSVMDRNMAQALGVGAVFDPVTYESTLRIDNLHALETLAYKLRPPVWPEFFPPVDTTRAARGKVLFEDLCVGCHQTFTVDGLMRTYKKHSIAESGLDGLTVLNFETNIMNAAGKPQPFPYAVNDLVGAIKEKAYADAGVTADEISVLENRAVRAGAQWDPQVRAPLRDSEDYPDTVGRRVYRSKTLVGIWATGPFLHNGSVPTVYDLLLPVDKRPVTFPVGTREYDVEHLGIQTDPAHYSLVPGQEQTLFDTRLPGNWNTGHEWDFYPQLTDEMRFDIIEFLKTFTDESVLRNGTRAVQPGEQLDTPASVALAVAPPPSGSVAGRLGWLAFVALILAWPVSRAGSWMMPRGLESLATEAQDIATLTSNMATYQRQCATKQNRPLARGTHAKGMCVRGQFEVFDLAKTVPDPVLARRLAQGIFSRPGVYQATVRFANASSLIMPDRDKDLRACSLAVEVPAGVFGVEPIRQDFALQTASVFTINDAHAFAAATSVNTAPSMFRGFLALPMRDKLGFVRTVAFAVKQLNPGTVPYQQETYWSTVPFRHGPDDVAKYRARASPGNPAGALGDGPMCLEEELCRHVTEDSQMSSFEFGVQLLDVDRMTYWGRRRESRFWIENATVEWKTSQAAFYAVARLTLTAGSVLSAEACREQYIDVTANSMPESAPIGGINRARHGAERASREARWKQHQ